MSLRRDPADITIGIDERGYVWVHFANDNDDGEEALYALEPEQLSLARIVEDCRPFRWFTLTPTITGWGERS